MVELFDVLDKTGNKINVKKSRTEDLKEDEYALVTHLWIKNSDGMFLTQQRSMQKKVDPGLWSITSGFVSTGEDTKTTIARELKEELGIDVSLEELVLHKRVFPKDDARHNHIADIYILYKDINEDTLVLQKEEVMAAKYMSIDEILDMMKNNDFMDFRTYYDDYYTSILGVK